ncbi:MAG: SDR family oxidoreductase [Deltaproteobacteria bacterium]|nr:SDR family oxidoreductase [Deltaproteobacteria bacterium]
MRIQPVLVTGSTGYVGGRLVPQLLSSGHRVRVLGRSLAKLQSRPWAIHPHLEMAQADVLDLESLKKACRGCRAVFYLVHSMSALHKDFAEADRKAAINMTKAAGEAGMERIIYLGGLGEETDILSKHLKSRTEVARILQSGRVPTTFLRAAMILGSGSASFEILRYLAERLPVMITPRWVRNPVQPIAIRNVLKYLQGCLENEETTGGTFDIGGPDVLTYQRLMEIYAEEAGLKRRWIIPVPVLTPRLSSLWIHLVTPVPAYIAGPLTEGLRNPVVCRENQIRSLIPQDLMSCRETIRLALGRIHNQCVETCWTDAGQPSIPEWVHCGDASYAGGDIMESGYRIVLDATPQEVWNPISRIGGKTGWYSAKALWYIRGAIDRLVGGTGIRRGRRDPVRLYAGDAVDFFRVLEVDEPHHLHLLAEMKFPGEASLEFRLYPMEGGRTELQQLSRYVPKGLSGILYWYILYPFHEWVYQGMLKGIARAVGKPIVEGPDRFAPRRHHVCRFDPRVS